MAVSLAYDRAAWGRVPFDGWQENPVTFPSPPLSHIDAAFLSMRLSDLHITFGAIYNEEIRCTDDLVLGDEFTIANPRLSFAANSTARRPALDCGDEIHVHLIRNLAGHARKQRLQLMTPVGALAQGYAITPEPASGKPPYILLPRHLDPAERLCIIDIRDL